MAKCRLGEKWKKKIAFVIGMPVLSAYTRGGWEHGIFEVWTDRNTAYTVNMNTKTFEPLIKDNQFV